MLLLHQNLNVNILNVIFIDGKERFDWALSRMSLVSSTYSLSVDPSRSPNGMPNPNPSYLKFQGKKYVFETNKRMQ